MPPGKSRRKVVRDHGAHVIMGRGHEAGIGLVGLVCDTCDDRRSGPLGNGLVGDGGPSAGAGLEAVVADYEGYREEGTTPVGRREVPNRGAVLVLGFGGPLRISGELDAAEGGRTVTSFVAGFGDLPILTEHEGRQQGIEIGLSATGAFRLLGVPMGELANRVVGLDELWGRRAVELSEQLAAAPSWKARFWLADRVLADAMDDAVGAGRHPDPEVVGAWHELERRRGDVSISEIQAATGWSRRRLAARFREQVGLTPTAAAGREPSLQQLGQRRTGSHGRRHVGHGDQIGQLALGLGTAPPDRAGGVPLPAGGGVSALVDA